MRKQAENELENTLLMPKMEFGYWVYRRIYGLVHVLFLGGRHTHGGPSAESGFSITIPNLYILNVIKWVCLYKEPTGQNVREGMRKNYHEDKWGYKWQVPYTRSQYNYYFIGFRQLIMSNLRSGKSATNKVWSISACFSPNLIFRIRRQVPPRGRKGEIKNLLLKNLLLLTPFKQELLWMVMVSLLMVPRRPAQLCHQSKTPLRMAQIMSYNLN